MSFLGTPNTLIGTIDCFLYDEDPTIRGTAANFIGMYYNEIITQNKQTHILTRKHQQKKITYNRMEILTHIILLI